MELADAAKAFVNRERKRCGLRASGRLKKGYRSSTLNPLALALEDCGVFEVWAVGDNIVLAAHPLDGRYSVHNEPEVVRWLHAYMAGKYPELVKPDTVIKIKKPGERKATIV